MAESVTVFFFLIFFKEAAPTKLTIREESVANLSLGCVVIPQHWFSFDGVVMLPFRTVFVTSAFSFHEDSSD